MKKLLAVSDKIIVEIVQDDLKTEGGIIIPETIKQNPHSTGRVTSVGEEIPADKVKVGDIVIFHRHAGGQATFFENKEIRILCYKEIYGVISESKE